MNHEAIIELANALEQGLPNVRFDLFDWLELRSCGTQACIAGHAVILRKGLAYASKMNAHRIALEAEEILGLDRGKANDLFTPAPGEGYLNDPRRAARVLRHLAETGDVDWNIA